MSLFGKRWFALEKKLVSRIVAFREKLRKSFHGLGAAVRCERPQRPFATDGATQKHEKDTGILSACFLKPRSTPISLTEKSALISLFGRGHL